MKNIVRNIIAVACFSLASVSYGEDSRVWTSRAGTTVDASLTRFEADIVYLTTKERKEIKLPVTDLSLADRQYLVEFAKADEKILTQGELGVPEKEVRVDSKTFVKLEPKLVLSNDSSEGLFEQMQTEHFLIAYAGKVRPHAVAEMAESLWHGMAFYHMNFRKDWGDKRKVIFLCEDRDAYKWLGEWYGKILTDAATDQDGQMRVARHTATWDKVGGTSLSIPAEICTREKFHESAIVFNLKDGNDYKKVFTAFPTHCIAGALLQQQMGGYTGGNGFFCVVTGHAYYKEIRLSGITETHLIDAGGSGGDEISTKSGFDDGTAWPRLLKSEVKRGKIKPNLLEVYTVDQDTLNPAKLVLMYSFANYLQSTPQRVCAFSRLIRRVEANQAMPEPEELAKIYGFDSVEKMEADWVAYITGNDFK